MKNENFMSFCYTVKTLVRKIFTFSRIFLPNTVTQTVSHSETDIYCSL